jgi:hypothetical protein
MILLCAICRIAISNEVIQLQHLSLLVEDNGKDHVPKGFYYIAAEDNSVIIEEDGFILNIADMINTNYSKQPGFGCCGLSGGDMNTLCNNGHEIGSECSDCWLPHYIRIPLNTVEAN